MKTSDAWVLEATLTAPDGAAGGEFGAAVALDGDTLVVGAPGRDGAAGGDVGAAHVFTRAGGVWDPDAVLVPDGAGAGWRCGTAVDVAGDLAVIGAPGAALDGRAESGTAVAFVGAATPWTPIGVALDPQLLQAGDGAGSSVATDGSTVLERRSPRTNDRFGAAVDVRGDALAVGVPSGTRRDGTTIITAPGAVELFGLAAGTFAPSARLSGFGPGNTRGESVRITGTRVVSGAPYAEGRVGVAGEAAALYVGVRTGSTWVDSGEALAAQVPEALRVTSRLGTGIAATGDTIAGGAPGPENAQGRVWLFQSRAPVFDAPPSATPAAALLLEPIQFASTASDPDGGDLSLFWSFGDGTGASASSVVHRYQAAGSFDVTLLASDGITEAAASTRIEVAPPTTTMSALELKEKYREALAAMGGSGGDDEGDPAETDIAANGVIHMKGTLALSAADVAALDATTRVRFALGRLAIDVALGDDRKYRPGAAKAKIVLAEKADADENFAGLRYLTLRLDWRRGDLAFRLKPIPSRRFRLFTGSVLGEALAGGASGPRTGSVAGVMAFGTATATFQRSYKGKVTTVDRERGEEEREYRSVVRVKAKGAL